MAQDIDLGKFPLNTTERIRFQLKKDGATWDLTGAIVSLIFEKPDRSTQFQRSMIVENAALGIVYYDTQTTNDITQAGNWTLDVHVIQGILNKRYPENISLRAVSRP